MRVRFSSKPHEANRRAAACDNATAVICPAGKKNPCQHPYDNVNYLRTEPCSFSWDWGPAFAPVGLWRPLYLQGYDSAVVRDITVVTTPQAAISQEDAEEEGVTIPRWGKRYGATQHPDAADEFDANDTSDSAVIARAFRRTDRELDLTTWDIEAIVYLDAGASDGGCGHRSVWNGAVTRRREFKPNAISLKTDSHEGEFGTQNPTGLLYNKIQSLYLLAKIISTQFAPARRAYISFCSSLCWSVSSCISLLSFFHADHLHV